MRHMREGFGARNGPLEFFGVVVFIAVLISAIQAIWHLVS